MKILMDARGYYDVPNPTDCFTLDQAIARVQMDAYQGTGIATFQHMRLAIANERTAGNLPRDFLFLGMEPNREENGVIYLRARFVREGCYRWVPVESEGNLSDVP